MMAKKRAKKTKQQKRQAQAVRQGQRRAEHEEQLREAEVATGPLSPGDRLNLMLGEMGERLHANPFAARAVALVIDYLLCGIACMLPMTLAFHAVGGQNMSSLADLAAAGMGTAGLTLVVVAALAVSFAYYALIPYKLLPGKTPGKYLLNLEIVMVDGTPASLGALAIRWAFVTLFETLCTFASSLVLQYLTLVAGELAGNIYTMVGAAATAVTIWLVWSSKPDRRALHDRVAGTWVYAGVQ